MSCPGDWMCGICNHMNFKKWDSCQKCNGSEVKAGDWYCGANAMNCFAHNYASRTSCYRCGAAKNDAGPLPGWKPGDWICTIPGCCMHNYAKRTECYKCKTPRDYGGAV